LNLADLPNAGRYGVILADFPWHFRTFDKVKAVPGRAAADPYPTMRREELAALPIANLAARDCALVLWIVGAHIPEALDLAKGYGFTFKTDLLIWDKGRMSMGYYTRKEAEQCFLFTRGSPRVMHRGIRQIIRAPRREHSRKPDEQYERLEALFGGPYLELFARQRRPGWDSWGNEVDKFSDPLELRRRRRDAALRLAAVRASLGARRRRAGA